jgi:RHS repeat-associated protein
VRPTAEGTLSGDTWTTTERYVWEGDSYYSPLVYLVYDNARYYPMFDGLGSTRQLTDEDEDVTDTYTYEAFGNSMGSTGSTTNPYRYVGSLGYYQIYPPAGGPALMHLGARYYMPEIGRFIQRDPPHGSLEPWQPSRRSVGETEPYSYCSGNPAILVDPTGSDWLCEAECWLACSVFCIGCGVIDSLCWSKLCDKLCQHPCTIVCRKQCKWKPNPINYKEVCKNDRTTDCCIRACGADHGLCYKSCENWINGAEE